MVDIISLGCLFLYVYYITPLYHICIPILKFTTPLFSCTLFLLSMILMICFGFSGL